MMIDSNDRKITLINDVVLYNHFLRNSNNTKVLVEYPTQWVREDFKTRRDQGRHSSTASYTMSLAGSITTTTAPTGPVVVPDIKKAKDAWMSRQRSKRDPEKYLIYRTIVIILIGLSTSSVNLKPKDAQG